MALSGETSASVIQTLTDAGFDQETIEKFLAFKAEGKTDECMKLLSCQRCKLLCRMHEIQKPMDVLDYFICKFKKEN